jgi:hypothetical protein
MLFNSFPYFTNQIFTIMKRTFTLLAFIFAAFAVNAQNRPLPPAALINTEVTVDQKTLFEGEKQFPDHLLKYSFTDFTEFDVGITVYDLQTNGCLNRRIHQFDDGSIGAVWMHGLQSTSFPDRGTGYNYFNGTTWGPMPQERVETIKTGWPTYAPVGANGEMIISHDAVDKLIINRRIDKGIGPWQESYLSGPPGFEKVTWPAVLTTGPDNNHVHLLGVIRDGYMGQPQTLGYWRSLDGADTWDIQYEVLEGTGADYYTQTGGDDVAWAQPRANTLAFISASVWHDLYLMKSTDNGDTWEKTVIWEHPYPFYNDNTVCDTFYTVDYSASVALDLDGMAHVAFGITRVRKDAVGSSYSLYKRVDGIGYWNETMPMFSNDLHALNPYGGGELIEDYNLIGWTQDVDGDGEVTIVDVEYYRSHGLSTMPYLVIDDNGIIYLAYSSATETFLTQDGTLNYRHIWMRTSFDNGVTWGEFYDLQADNVFHLYSECIYPHMADIKSEFMHILYNKDTKPGLAQRDSHEWHENQQVHIQIPVQYFIGVSELSKHEASIDVGQNYPNPATGKTTIIVNTPAPAELSFTIRNITGQLVYAAPVRQVFPGTHQFSFNASSFQSGVYFYTVDDGIQAITKKMIVQ